MVILKNKIKLDIVIPVYNNSDVLEKSVLKQIHFYSEHLNTFNWNIIIANNKSTDNTLDIAKRLSKQFKRVNFIDIPVQGRGNAINIAWAASKSDFLSYMDVDLATDLRAFPELINTLIKGYDLSVGSKYLKKSFCKRNPTRYFVSRIFNEINKILFNARFTDAQCGFKAIKKTAATVLLPKIKDGNWFFDTELLVLAQENGFKLAEVPVTWKELGIAKKSGVKLVRTILEFINKMIELKLR